MKKTNAYFTVEAAIVFPLVMSAVLFVIFLFFFQYDRCLLEQDTAMLAIYGKSLNVIGEADRKRAMEAEISRLGRDRYVAWEMSRLQVVMGKTEMKIQGEGYLRFPLPGINFFTDKDVWCAGINRKIQGLSPSGFIRLYRKIRDEGE